jgi:hypothetical protein
VDNNHILACIARNVKTGIRSEILDDSSIESFFDVDDIILCSNIQCATYDKEYSFESVHITEAPKGDWFCPSCRELPSANNFVAQEPVDVNSKVPVVTKVRRLAAIACDKKRVAAEMEMSTDSRDNDHAISGSSAVTVAAERGKYKKSELSKSAKRRRYPIIRFFVFLCVLRVTFFFNL